MDNSCWLGPDNVEWIMDNSCRLEGPMTPYGQGEGIIAKQLKISRIDSIIAKNFPTSQLPNFPKSGCKNVIYRERQYYI